MGKGSSREKVASGLSRSSTPCDFPTRFTRQVNIDVGAWLEPKAQKRMDRFVQLAVIEAELALQDSGLALEGEDKTRIGTLIGSGIGG